MRKLYVFADFDWLKEIELVGELSYESLRGSDSYGFSFHDEWLRRHGDLLLSEDFMVGFYSVQKMRDLRYSHYICHI